MGVHANIGIDKFPRQGSLLGQPVEVCFQYKTKTRISGVCVRDDSEAPWVTMFKLADGRHVLATECQYSTIKTFTQMDAETN